MAEGARAQLFVLAGPDLARSFDMGERAVLGRSDECDVVLQDRSISRKHAVITFQEGRWFVQDLGSTNGVTKNGRRVERVELKDGEEFRLGELPLRFRAGAAEIKRDDHLEFASPNDPVPPAPAPAAPPPARARPSLLRRMRRSRRWRSSSSPTSTRPFARRLRRISPARSTARRASSGARASCPAISTSARHGGRPCSSCS
jgi:predicted component of type VI protein secretion system